MAITFDMSTGRIEHQYDEPKVDTAAQPALPAPLPLEHMSLRLLTVDEAIRLAHQGIPPRR
ncbi:hypothetical protein HNQ59_003767 [Chitinivorax tropicus]|uniref:Uncharacterized protein n=1 Tax=Chitinivorax tropicus TaxID=714531 RepID=A0A840MP81_9PROT|nr:hypothetical protein [Chitinivorax tropicus]MBB5020448.1 hypothetical protein [Chitinivorax tropicus]